MSNLAKKESPTSSAVYTIAEAARLCMLPRREVRRWVQGEKFNRIEINRSPRSVGNISPAANGHGTVVLDFHDLIELRYVKAFVEMGVSWHLLCATYDRAAEMLRVDNPFATKRFFASGHVILKRIADPHFLNIVGTQLIFARIVDRYFGGRDGVDFDNGAAVRWWPMGKKRLVVIDPERSFGQPIVSTEGVPTAVLYKAYVAESVRTRNGKKGKDDNPFDAREWTPEGGKPATIVRLGQVPSKPRHIFDKAAIGRVANWYMVEELSVRAAIEYESEFLALA
jgi:hypothetical protein